MDWPIGIRQTGGYISYLNVWDEKSSFYIYGTLC